MLISRDIVSNARACAIAFYINIRVDFDSRAITILFTKYTYKFLDQNRDVVVFVAVFRCISVDPTGISVRTEIDERL